MSVVSSGDESYVQDLVNQKENREDNRKEECLEDAYKLYKCTLKEKKLPENEEMLLTLFENVLKKKNDKMRKKDTEFDELVDKVLAQHALSKHIRKNAQSEEEKLTESIKILPGKERIKTNALEGAKRTMRAKAKMEQEKQSRRQIVKQSMVDADDDEKMAVIIHSKISNQQPSISENQDSENKNESQERTERGWGIGSFRRNATNSTKGEEVSQTKEVDAQIGGKESTIDNSENNEERNDASLSKIDSSEIEEKTEKVSDVKRGWGMGFFGRIENTSTKTDDISETEEAENVDIKIETRESESEERKEENLENAEEIDVKQMCLSTEGSQNIKEGGGMFFFGFGGKRNDKTTKVDGEIVLEPEEQEFDDLGNESGDKVTHDSDAEEETIETAPVNHPLSNDTQKLVDSDTLENENCHLEEKNNKPQEIAKRFGFFRFVAKEKEDTTNDDERKSLQSKEHAVEGSIDEESNVQENKATVSDISFAKDDDDLYENTVVVVGIPRTIKMDFAEEKKNSEEPIQDIYDLVKCGTETFSKDAEHDHVPSTIDFLDNDIQYNKFMERLHNGKSLEDDEEYELKLLKRIKQGGTLNDSEIEELKMLRKSREQLDQNIEIIDTLHKGRDIDDNFDDNQYQSLMEQMKSGATLHENEFFELALLERMNRGEYLQDDEIEELKMLRQIREQLDQNMETMEAMETLCQEKESGPDKFDKQSMEQVQTREVDHELHEPDSLECTIQGKARQDLEMEDQNAARQSIEQDDQNKKDIHNLHKGVDIEFYSDDDPRHELENDEQHRQEVDTYDRKDEEKDKNNIISTEACGEELFVKEYQSEFNSVDITEQNQEEEDDDDVEEEDKNNITVEMSMAEEEDSVYRRDLLERQKAGSRLSKMEFQWLQILMKKYRNEELLEDDFDELRMMRNQRNETGSPEVEFVNTKRLLEEEVKKKAKRELKEKRRKEKEERREQRSKRIKQKQLDRKIMRENKKREGDQGKRISESTRGTHSENKNQPDVLSRLDTANSVQIIGSPSMQPPGSGGDDKAEPKRGVFGGVFGTNKKKERKMQELAEAKRLQEELIKEQMKALALDNEVEELEREKVMQEQLIQETIERKIADASVGSSSWETDSIDKNMESENDSSSLSSSDSSLSDSSSEPGEIFGSKEGLIIPKKIDYEAGNEDEHGNQVEHHQKLKHLDSASSDIANFPIESSHESNELGKIPTHNVLISGQRLSTKTGKLGIPKNSDEEVRRSEDIKNRTKSLSLGAHLKRQKKKSGVRKTKYGDDVSLGTLQLSKVIKVESDRSRRVKIHPDFANKTHERPWIAATNPNTQVKSTKNEKTGSTGISDNSYQFSQSVVSRISEADVKVKSVTSFHSSNNEGDYINKVYNDIMEDSDVEKPPYESTSITSLGEEAYDLDIREYENIERTGVALNFISRLADKLESKKTEFDTTWENIVADETVVAQINQRLKERQRLKENMKEKKKQEKKEEEESNGLQDTPRLFLFEGEKVEMKNKKRKKKKKKTRKTQRKLDKTLTKEFRKAMEEIFDSDSDGNYRHKTLSGEDFDDDDDGIQDYHIDPTRTRIQSYDDHRLYDDVSERSVSENDRAAVDSDEESEKFDGGYLKRLQARSMPQQVKQMLSGRNLTNYKSTYSESSDELSFSSDGEDQIYHSARRKYKRKKNGELANDDIDPAEIYAQELEKKKEKKAFTVAGLRKEMEDDLKQQLKQQQQQNNNNAKIGVGGFNIKPIPLNKKSKVPKPKNDLNLSTGMQRASQRFFATTSNDQGKRPPETIEEEDEDEEEEGGAFLTGGINSEDFGNVDSFKDNLMSYRSKLAWKKNINFGNAGSNLKSSLAVSIKNPFKAKKSPQIGGGGGGVDVAGGGGGGGVDVAGGGGGLLSIQEGGHNEEPPNHFNNNITGMGGFQSDNNNNNRISVLKAIGKMNSKNLLTKFKLPGKKSNNFGGGLMMDDDYDDDN